MRTTVLNLVEQHMHLHPLIPNITGKFLTEHEIWTNSVKEMYEFCASNNLKHLWVYMWNNWYRIEMWKLWTRSVIADKICIFHTTMLVESHWKVVKRDFLPKFFKPRLDLVVYIIIIRLIPHHKQQYNKYFNGREISSWRKDFKKEWILLQKKNY